MFIIKFDFDKSVIPNLPERAIPGKYKSCTVNMAGSDIAIRKGSRAYGTGRESSSTTVAGSVRDQNRKDARQTPEIASEDGIDST